MLVHFFNSFVEVPERTPISSYLSYEKLNPGGMITSFEATPEKKEIVLMGGGTFLAYSEQKPSKVILNREVVEFEFMDNQLIVNTMVGSENLIEIVY